MTSGTYGAFSNRISTTITALALTCPWVRTVLSPGRSRAPRQARSSRFHRLAGSIIVTCDWPPERRPAHYRGQQPHLSAGAFRPCAWQARTCRFDCRMTASQRRTPLSRHRICSTSATRGHMIRVISAQIEFLGGTTIDSWRCRESRANSSLMKIPVMQEKYREYSRFRTELGAGAKISRCGQSA